MWLVLSEQLRGAETAGGGGGDRAACRDIDSKIVSDVLAAGGGADGVDRRIGVARWSRPAGEAKRASGDDIIIYYYTADGCALVLTATAAAAAAGPHKSMFPRPTARDYVARPRRMCAAACTSSLNFYFEPPRDGDPRALSVRIRG